MSLGSLPDLAALPLLGAGSAAPASGTGAAASNSGPSWLTGKLAQYVTIGLGLILIIAGLFQFKTVEAVTTTAVKAAA